MRLTKWAAILLPSCVFVTVFACGDDTTLVQDDAGGGGTTSSTGGGGRDVGPGGMGNGGGTGPGGMGSGAGGSGGTGGSGGGVSEAPPKNVNNTSGAGNVSSPSYRARVILGAPSPMGTATSGNHRVRLGPLGP